jgi:predicted GTPase
MATLTPEGRAALERVAAALAPADLPCIDALRGALDASSPRRVALVGRRGAGKSSLLNALAQRPVARVGGVTDTTLRAMAVVLDVGLHVLDTPGLRAGGRPTRRDDVTRALAAFCPEVLCLTVSATEVDAGIDDDLDDLVHLRAVAPDAAIVAAVTRVDDLEPVDDNAPPFGATKHRQMVRATTTLHRHLLRRAIVARGVVPVCTFATWRGNTLDDDARWNLAPLARALAVGAPRDARPVLTATVARAVIEQAVHDTVAIVTQAPRSRHDVLLAARRASMVRALRDLASTRGSSSTFTPPRVGAAQTLRTALRSTLAAFGVERGASAIAEAETRALGTHTSRALGIA